MREADQFVGHPAMLAKVQEDGMQRFFQSIPDVSDGRKLNSLYSRAVSLGLTVSTIHDATRKVLQDRKDLVAKEGTVKSAEIDLMKVTKADVEKVIEDLEEKRRLEEER